MALIHHVVKGSGRPPIVFVHGFACAHGDWGAQVGHFSPRHQTVAVDLRGHGATPGSAEQCSIERYGADVADVMRTLALPPAVLVGHSMGCRVVVEAALQGAEHTAGVILVDGSQFAPEIEAALKQSFAADEGYASLVRRWFRDMFTANSDETVATAVIERAGRLPRAIGEKVLLDMVGHDVRRLAASLSALHVPVMAIQSTASNDKRERRSMVNEETTPYLDMLRACLPSVRIEIIERTGHFPQIDEAAATNRLVDSFLATVSAR